VLEVDVLIVGAGPAGATAALNLAPYRRVALVERRAEVVPRIGESLVPAARRLLADMGLLESFLAQGHEPWYGNRAVWGSTEAHELDFLRAPDGHGWHLERARFEQWLRHAACARGAELLSPATLVGIDRDDHRWRAQLKTDAGPIVIAAGLIIDGGGRAAPVARKLGAHVYTSDRLICVWVYGHDRHASGRGLTYVEAAEDGWWYTAPIPGRQRVLAFHTDADLLPPGVMREQEELLRRARMQEGLSALLSEAGFVPGSRSGVTAAHSARLEPAAGADWLVVGDAALSFDPLSSQGLFNALYTGLAAAETAELHLRGNRLSLTEYARAVRVIGDIYRRHLAFHYAGETRWREASFWRRRHNSIGSVAEFDLS
jgi:flavin-dependent dehydrogenase